MNATAALASVLAALTISACSSNAPDVPDRPTAIAQNVAVAPHVTSAPQRLDDQVHWLLRDIDEFWSLYGLKPDNYVQEQAVPFTCPGVPGMYVNIAVNCGYASGGVILYDKDRLAAEVSHGRYVLAEGMAHEVGHNIESSLLHNEPGYSHEMAADCFSGMYIAAKHVPLDAAVADFRRTGMAQYGRLEEAVTEFTYGYNNFDADHITRLSAERCAKKELR